MNAPYHPPLDRLSTGADCNCAGTALRILRAAATRIDATLLGVDLGRSSKQPEREKRHLHHFAAPVDHHSSQRLVHKSEQAP